MDIQSLLMASLAMFRNINIEPDVLEPLQTV